LKTSVLNGTSIWTTWAPEIVLLNYAPRVRIPTLMLNGRYAFGEPLETAQRPLFALLGSPAEDKRHTVLEAGHVLPIDVGLARCSRGSTTTLDRSPTHHPRPRAFLPRTAVVEREWPRRYFTRCVGLCLFGKGSKHVSRAAVSKMSPRLG
jgi:hypothetical protein